MRSALMLSSAMSPNSTEAVCKKHVECLECTNTIYTIVPKSRHDVVGNTSNVYRCNQSPPSQKRRALFWQTDFQSQLQQRVA